MSSRPRHHDGADGAAHFPGERDPASAPQPGAFDQLPERSLSLGPYRTPWRLRRPRPPRIPPVLLLAGGFMLLGLVLYFARGGRRDRAGQSDAPPILLDAITSFPPPEADLPPATPLEPLLVADAPQALAVLSPPEGVTRITRGEVLSIRFNRPMVRGSEVDRPLADPPVVFDPPVPGTFRWGSRSTLVFTPDPAAFHGIREVALRFREGTTSLDGEELVDDVPRTIVFDSTPRFLGHRATVAAGQPLALFFGAQVSAAEFAREILVWEVDGRRPIPVRVKAVGFEPVEREGEPPRFRVEVAPQRAVEPGARIAVALAPRWDVWSPNLPRTVQFTLAPRPRIVGVGCEPSEWGTARCAFEDSPGEIVEIGASLGLLASKALAGVGPADVRISPPIRDLRVELGGEGDQRGRLITISGEWESDQVYEVRLGALRTVDGDRVLPLAPLAVRSSGHSPSVEAPSGAYAYERDAPIRIRVRGIHVDAGRAIVRPVPEGREVEAMLAPATFASGTDDGDAQPAVIPLPVLLPNARPNRWDRGVLDARSVAPGTDMMVVAFEATAGEAPRAATASFLQSTDLGVTAEALERGVVVWVSSIARGGPIADARVELRTAEGRWLGETRTDAVGAAWIRTDGRRGSSVEWNPLAAPTMVVVRAGGDRAVLRLDARNGVGPEALGVSSAGEGSGLPSLRATVIADRGAYRPGERMHVLAIARVIEGARASLPPDRPVRCVLEGPGEVPIAQAQVSLVRGRADVSWTLPEGAPLGAHALKLVTEDGTVLGSTSIRIAEFRQPRFRVDLRTPEVALLSGERLQVGVEARYLFGAPLEGATMQWAVVREGRAPYPVRWEAYAFGPIADGARAATLAWGDATLSREGEATIASSIALAAPVRTRIRVEAEVRDATGETSAASRTLIAYPASFEVGVRRQRAWIELGTPVEIDAIAIDHRGELVAGRTIEARVVREGWHAWWEWQESDARAEQEGTYRLRRGQRREIVHRCRWMSSEDEGGARCAFTPTRPGTYVLEVEGRDEAGRVTLAQTRVYVAGPDEHPDRDPPGAPIALTPSREEWAVGEEAELAFESPWPDAEALIAVHHDSLLSFERRRVGAGGQVVRVRLTEDMVPNAFVTLALIRARSGEPEPGDRIDRHAPDLRFGAATLVVRPERALLDVTIESPTRGRPGDRVPVVVRVRDPLGAPVRGAQVALWAVDEGTLRLTGYATPSAIGGLFVPRGARFALEDLRRMLVSRIDPSIEAQPSGDGGFDDNPADALEVRERFDPTPLWAPRLVTDADGAAAAEFVLPARPTEYRIMAIAIDEGSRNGRASSGIVVEQPLILRTALPRFATQGDRFEAVAFLHNRGEVPLEARVRARIGGIERPARTVVIPAHGEVRFSEPVDIAPDAIGTLAIAFEARAESGMETVTHGAEAVLPIVPAARWVRRRALVAATGEQALELAFAPRGAASPRGTLRIAVASHPFVGLDGALDALEASWWRGTEVEAARLWAIASYLRMSEGLRHGECDETELRDRAARALERLMEARTREGGFAQLSARLGDVPHETALALRALAAAEEAGIEIPEGVRDAGLDRLAAFAREGAFGERYGRAGQESYALALRLLAEAGRPVSGLDALYEQREFAPPAVLAHLALALPAHDRRRETALLLAVHRLFPELEIPGISAGPGSRDGNPPRAAYVERDRLAVATVLEAAARIEVGHRYLRRLAQELLRLAGGRADGLGSPIEIAASLAAFSACSEAFGDPGPISPSLAIDGTVLRPVSRGAQGAIFEVPWARVAEGPHAMLARVEGAEEPFFVALDAQWAVPIGEAETVARGRAVALHRVYETPGGTPMPPGSRVPLGTMIRVRLFLYLEGATSDRIAVRDPLPAGFESVDADLHTSPRTSLMALLGVGPDEDAADPRGYHAMRTLPYLDHRVFDIHATTFFLERLPSGLHELTYAIRATTPGTFVVPPASVEALRDEHFVGRSTAATLVVEP